MLFVMHERFFVAINAFQDTLPQDNKALALYTPTTLQYPTSMQEFLTL